MKIELPQKTSNKTQSNFDQNRDFTLRTQNVSCSRKQRVQQGLTGQGGAGLHAISVSLFFFSICQPSLFLFGWCPTFLHDPASQTTQSLSPLFIRSAEANSFFEFQFFLLEIERIGLAGPVRVRGRPSVISALGAYGVFQSL